MVTINFNDDKISFISGRVDCFFDSETEEDIKLQRSIDLKIGNALRKALKIKKISGGK